MTDEDLSDLEHLQAYQARMKQLYTLEKFAFVDESGLIYTSLGMQDSISDYAIDYENISGPEISILNVSSPEKKVIIPVELQFESVTFRVCFMEIDMQEMLSGVCFRPDWPWTNTRTNRSGFVRLFVREMVHCQIHCQIKPDLAVFLSMRGTTVKHSAKSWRI